MRLLHYNRRHVRRVGIFAIITLVGLFGIYLFRAPFRRMTDNLLELGKERVIISTYQKAMISSSGYITYMKKYVENRQNYVSDRLSSQFVINQFVEEEPILYASRESGIVLSDSTVKKEETKDYLSESFLLSNGTKFETQDTRNDWTAEVSSIIEERETSLPESHELEIEILNGELNLQEEQANHLTKKDSNRDKNKTKTTLAGNPFTMEKLNNATFLLNNFYIIDEELVVDESLFNAKKLLAKDMTIKQKNDKPQILIYHTHSQETYADSRDGVVADTVVGVGSYLAEILTKQYGYQVIHDMTCYDIVDGVLDRNAAYDVAKKGIEKNLEAYPSIEVIIDLHRDGNAARVTTIDGKKTARIMLFNGLSRNRNGSISYLPNPKLEENLAFSLQLQLRSLETYPGLFYRNYLHCYRYNQHFRGKSLLIELGTEKNSLEEAKNAMVPFAEILDDVLQGTTGD